MKIIAVDDEVIALEGLVSAIRSAEPTSEVHGFRYADEALEYAKANPCDVAFLDVEMREMDGIELARCLKEIKPDINLIFATGFSSYMKHAFDVHASGYICKPISTEAVRRELADLRRPVAKTNRLRAQTFGDFQVFVDGEPIKFKYKKTAELLAYLIDRKGALCSNKVLMAALFADDDHTKYYNQLRLDLLTTLKNHSCESVIVQDRGLLGVATDKIDCDYYDYLNGKLDLQSSYQGEYMAQYSFAEVTNGWLYSRNKKRG